MDERCLRLRESLGSFVLGHLDPVEDAAVSAHLDACDDCADEATELAATAAVLALAAPASSGVAAAPEGLGDRVVARVRADRARTRRATYRRVLAAAAVIVVLAGGAAAVAVAVDNRGEEALEQVVLASDAGAEATATFHPWNWGTGIKLEAQGLDPGDTYAVWLADASGRRLSAGTFVAVDDGRVSCYMTSAMLRPAAVALGVTDVDDGTDVLETALR